MKHMSDRQKDAFTDLVHELPDIEQNPTSESENQQVTTSDGSVVTLNPNSGDIRKKG